MMPDDHSIVDQIDELGAKYLLTSDPKEEDAIILKIRELLQFKSI